MSPLGFSIKQRALLLQQQLCHMIFSIMRLDARSSHTIQIHPFSYDVYNADSRKRFVAFLIERNGRAEDSLSAI